MIWLLQYDTFFCPSCWILLWLDFNWASRTEFKIEDPVSDTTEDQVVRFQFEIFLPSLSPAAAAPSTPRPSWPPSWPWSSASPRGPRGAATPTFSSAGRTSGRGCGRERNPWHLLVQRCFIQNLAVITLLLEIKWYFKVNLPTQRISI